MIGRTLGPYRILAKLGEGGMGEVYRARDSRLNRDVALKVLPEIFALDAERLTRFKREAQLLASLNHPNIATIHGFEEGDSTAPGQPRLQALVMELVDGPTLADRIAEGSIAIDEALRIARQIAEALEAAHERGVIHRDLKPANIKLTPTGQVKVLDFGLAKLMEQETLASAMSMSPTLSVQATNAGVILGTAAYMSPEQARGKTTDRRTDVWAFGCVLFEMLTGRRAFDTGETVSDAIAAILRSEPDWSALPAETPSSIRTLLRRCLQKDVQKRLPHIGVARIEIEEGPATTAPLSEPPPANVGMPPRSTRQLYLVGGVGLLTGIALASLAWLVLRTPPSSTSPVRFSIDLRATDTFAVNGFYRNLAISRDGTRMAYVANSAGGPARQQLMLRVFSEHEATPLANVAGVGAPFFSPDGQWVAYFTAGGGGNGEIKKVSVSGGPPVLICRYSGNARGGSWSDDDTIVFATTGLSSGLMSVPAGGGEAKQLTKPDTTKGERDHVFPSALPRGRGVLFTILSATQAIEAAQVAVLDPSTGRWSTLVHGGGDGIYVDTGHIVYGSGGTLRSVRFDLDTRTVVGDPVPVVDDVMTFATTAAVFDVARNGTLIYMSGGAQTSAARPIVWVDRQGREQPIDIQPPQAYAYVRLSPDGSRLALDVRNTAEGEIYVWDFGRRTLTRHTFDPLPDQNPLWSPDGRRLIFNSFRDGLVSHVYWQASDVPGGAQPVAAKAKDGAVSANSVLPDGKGLIVSVDSGNSPDLAILWQDEHRDLQPLLQSESIDSNGEVSPDGKWLAYQTVLQGGRQEVFVSPFPNVNEGTWQISNGGGSRPAWTRKGRELVYSGPGGMMAVPVETSPTFTPGTPVRLFANNGEWYTGVAARNYDVTADGERFVIVKIPDTIQNRQSAPIKVVLNWTQELKQRLP